MKNTFILLFILLNIGISQAQQGEVFGETHNHQVKLKWSLLEIPTDLDGFWVKTRIKRKNNTWSTWKIEQQQVIVPEVSKTKDLADFIQDEKVLNEVKEYRTDAFSGEFERIKLKKISSADLIDGLNNEEEKRMLAIILYYDYYTTLASGFGFVSPNNVSDKEIEYGIFLQRSGKVDLQPTMVDS